MITTGKTYKEKIVQALNKLADIIDPDGDTNDNILFKDSSDDVIAGSLERIADHYEAGGSGGGAQTVFLSFEYGEESTVITMDKTYAEIKAMVANGPVFVSGYPEDGSYTYVTFGFVSFLQKLNSANWFVKAELWDNNSAFETVTFTARTEDGYPVAIE